MGSFKKNTLQEGKKYVFESAEVTVSLPRYDNEMSEYITRQQYESLKKELEVACNEELDRRIKENGNIFYTIGEDGSYVEHRSYYVFKNGGVYASVIDWGEEIGTTEGGYKVYSKCVDLLDEEGEAFYEHYINVTDGSYTENEITSLLDDTNMYLSDGDLVVSEKVENDFLIEYTATYTFRYAISD